MRCQLYIYILSHMIGFVKIKFGFVGKYAVWDKVTNKPWLGIKGYEEIKDEAGKKWNTNLVDDFIDVVKNEQLH